VEIQAGYVSKQMWMLPQQSARCYSLEDCGGMGDAPSVENRRPSCPKAVGCSVRAGRQVGRSAGYDVAYLSEIVELILAWRLFRLSAATF